MIGCPETSMANYQPPLRNIPEERRPHSCIFSYKATNLQIRLSLSLKICGSSAFSFLCLEHVCFEVSSLWVIRLQKYDPYFSGFLILKRCFYWVLQPASVTYVNKRRRWRMSGLSLRWLHSASLNGGKNFTSCMLTTCYQMLVRYRIAVTFLLWLQAGGGGISKI